MLNFVIATIIIVSHDSITVKKNYVKHVLHKRERTTVTTTPHKTTGKILTFVPFDDILVTRWEILDHLQLSTRAVS